MGLTRGRGEGGGGGGQLNENYVPIIHDFNDFAGVNNLFI